MFTRTLVPFVAPFLALTALAPAANANPLSYYRFEGVPDSIAGTIADSSGRGQVGHAVGSPLYRSNVPVSPIPQTGAANTTSVQLNPGDHLDFNQPFPLNLAGDVTLEFWINPEHRTDERDVIWGRSASTDSGNRFNLYTYGGSINLDYREANFNIHPLFQVGQIPIPAGAWSHVAFTRAGNNWSAYRNGVLVATAVDANPALPTAPAWTIGGRVEAPFGGQIDEMRFSDHALTPQEMLITSGVVPFATLDVKLDIDLGQGPGDGKTPGQDGYELHGQFALGANSNGISPGTEDIVVSVGTSTITIPAGSLSAGNDQNFHLIAPIAGLHDFHLDLKHGQLDLKSNFVNLDGTVNPVAVSIQIGNDSGKASLRVRGHLDSH